MKKSHSRFQKKKELIYKMQIFFLFYSAVIIRDGGAEIKKQQN
jgi:hypothetical protein